LPLPFPLGNQRPSILRKRSGNDVRDCVRFSQVHLHPTSNCAVLRYRQRIIPLSHRSRDVERPAGRRDISSRYPSSVSDSKSSCSRNPFSDYFLD